MSLKRRKILKIFFWTLLCFCILLYWFSLPKSLFPGNYSTVLFSSNNELLGAKVSSEGMWEFPPSKEIPVKFEKALLTYEDRYFYYHPGINPFSIVKAAIRNLKAGKIISGGSTITMQLIRISRNGRSRSYAEKLIETILATRAEIRYHKKEILSQYISHAPFGGNIVGLQAASWRYFGCSADHLSWSESATLAVLPNAPSLIHPGRNRQLLLKKRNNLLKKLYKIGIINKDTYSLSLLENIPEKPYELPKTATHMLEDIAIKNPKGIIAYSTIDIHLQKNIEEITERYMQQMRDNYIFNAAVLVADIETGNVISYVGNCKSVMGDDHGNQVDIITSPRSTGSVLKPFLYAAALDDGQLLPNALVPDVPMIIAGYSPKNYSNTYDGVVPATQALARSLNIPAVCILREYGVQRFYDLLQKTGMTTLVRNADTYGLSLILGGAEGKLWDICSMYTGMARSLKYYAQRSDNYDVADYNYLHFLKNDKKPDSKPTPNGIISAGAIWLTFNAMLKVNKPVEETGWEYYLSSWKVGWKTGTSFGFRDAWAVGLNRRYIVGVWVGNADGTGRPGLIGVECAAPLMFEVFRELNYFKWFSAPYDDLVKVPICRKSGYIAGDNCPEVDTIFVPIKGKDSKQCPYHRLIRLDPSEKYRVTSNCCPVYKMKSKIWFVLPPLLEAYYKHKDPSYKTLPPYKEGCAQDGTLVMEFIYPNEGASIYLPINISQKHESVIFKLSHHNANSTVFWFLDGTLIDETKGTHEISFTPKSGPHKLVIVDNDGNSLNRDFTIISK